MTAATATHELGDRQSRTRREIVEELKDKALLMRKCLFRLAHEAPSLHIGGDLSMTDEMTVIFEYLLRLDPARPK